MVMCGLDIGGTKMEIAVFDDRLSRLHTRRVATPASDYGRFIQSIRELVEEADGKFKYVDSIGVGVPGIRDRRGRSFSVNVPCITGRNVKDDLGSALDRPVAVINDGRAFALSEAYGGAGHGNDLMIGVILGTGAFGGYCIAGRLQGGRDGVAGEWGHLAIAATVRDRHALPLHRCGCGKRGCMETYVSGQGLSRIHAHVAGSGLAADGVVEGMRAGNASCQRAFGIWIDCVASCFAQLVLHINPEAIVVGGGLSRIGELYERLPSTLSKYLFGGIPSPDILPARFGDASGVRGAAIHAARRCGWTGRDIASQSPGR